VNRKQRREAERKRKKGDPNQKMADQVSLFHKLPDKCDACSEDFDKKNKEMAFSWSVVVNGETVRLFCPECIRKTKEAIKQTGGNDGQQESNQ